MVQIVIKRNIASVFCLLFSVICYSQITLSQIERADTTGQLVYMIQTIDSTGIQEYVLKSTVLSGIDNPTIDTFLIQNDTLFASLEDDGEENKFVVLSSYLPRGVTDQANGLDISLNGNNIETALDPSENSTQAPALADLVIIEDVTDGGIHSATLTQLQTLIDTDSDAQILYYIPSSDRIIISAGNSIDITEVDTQRDVTDQANGLDISLNGNNIETALDPSENSTQAPALADLVIIEDVTDGGIHSATLTQLQTLIDTDSDAQTLSYTASTDIITISGGNTIDITEVDTQRDVTDQANGLDISLNGNNIETALDPSENSTQAPALADLVIIEDVTDGGIHSATLTQLQTLISDSQNFVPSGGTTNHVLTKFPTGYGWDDSVVISSLLVGTPQISISAGLLEGVSRLELTSQSLGTCTGSLEGSIKYDGDNFYGCNGTSWIQLDN